MGLKNSWKTRGFPNETGSIGEKVAKKWLEKKGYKVFFFQEIMGTFAYLLKTTLQLKMRRKEEYKKKDRRLIQEIEKNLRDVFGQKYEEMKKFDESLRRLAKTEEDTRLANKIKKVRPLGFDFITKKDREIFFIDVKVNNAKLEKFQKKFVQIAKEHGFKIMLLRLNIEIEIGDKIQFIECEKIYGEKND